MKFIEELLYEKTKDTKSEILFTQWSYDKKIIPKALNSIANLFPHYSLHDESHSITIINNIIRILGKDAISKLSAIDLWLILSSSYYHDIGMIVSAQKLIDASESSGFINFFKNLLQNKTHGLYEFAKDYKVKNNKIVYANTSLSLKQHDGIKFILAEYFRQQHSNRSEVIIVNPTDEFNLSSPRNAMPERIFKTLGKICSSHTKSFDDVMKLSFCEVGIDTEDMHPRFVACLLRIGDLLDLDNDRFSDVMLSTLSKVPIDTLMHKSKHMSIESFRADKNEISIFAKCQDYDVAEITQHWFDYINSEITNQMSNWNKIVPFKDIGYLPSIESLKVELAPYEYIDGKNKPKFSVDTSKALNLLRGAGIYEKPEQSFREILQNAVDSTLIRIWEEHKQNSKIFDEPFTDEFKNLIKDYPIKVSIKSLKVKDKYKIWEITIEDNAMGLSSNDLKYLMNAGSSSKNLSKSNIVDNMPKWLRPSGVFGIGFQSIFQLTEEVNIQTKDFKNEQYQKITLHSPESSKNGAILLEKKDSDHSIKPGSKIIFKYKTKKIPHSYSFKQEDNFSKQIIDDYDFFKVESLDVDIAYFIDEIVNFSSACYFPIKIELDTDNVTLNKEEKKPFKYFDKKTFLEFNISPNTNSYNGYQTKVFYKNQYIQKKNLDFMFLRTAINIHTDIASKVLTISRNAIKKEYDEKLRKNSINALFRTLTKNYTSFNKKEKEKISMFLNYYSNEKTKKKFDISLFNDYENVEFNIKDNESKKLLELLQMDEIHIKCEYNHEYNGEYLNLKVDDKKFYIEFDHRIENEDILFLLHMAKSDFKSINISENDEMEIFILSKEEQRNPYTNNKDFEKILKKLNSKYSNKRVFLPCQIEEYKHLRIKDTAYIPMVGSKGLSNFKFVPKMLSPYIKEGKKIIVLTNDKFFDWVYTNKYDTKTTLEDIKSSYEQFIKEFESIVK